MFFATLMFAYDSYALRAPLMRHAALTAAMLLPRAAVDITLRTLRHAAMLLLRCCCALRDITLLSRALVMLPFTRSSARLMLRLLFRLMLLPRQQDI